MPAKKRKTAVKRPAKRKRAAGAKPGGRISFGRLAWFLVLAALFTLSIGVAGYVIFFRVAIAAETSGAGAPILFEEPVEYHDPPPEPLPPAAAGPEQPRAAIIIDDMGYHEQVGRDLLALDMALSFSFLPHAPFTEELEHEAYQRGRTVLLHQPLEPRNREWDPGPGALYVADSREQRRLTVTSNLSLVAHATGVNNHMGSRFTEDTASMSDLFDVLVAEELFFVDSLTSGQSVGLALARERNVPFSSRDVFLDNVQNTGYICLQLEKLAERARREGQAVGIGHPHQATLEALQQCAGKTLEGIELVGVEKLVN